MEGAVRKGREREGMAERVVVEEEGRGERGAVGYGWGEENERQS